MTSSWTCIPSWVLFKQRMHLHLVQIGKKGLLPDVARRCTSVCESKLLPSERSISDLSIPVQLRETKKNDLISS